MNNYHENMKKRTTIMKDTIIRLDGYARWAKLFESDRDEYEGHFEDTGGRYQLDFYPESQEVIDEFLSTGIGKESMGNPRVRVPGGPLYGSGDPDLGIGAYIKLKRNHKGPWVDENGVDKYGGPPKVYNHDTSEDPLCMWDLEKDGKIWNGSKVSVKLYIRPDGGRSTIRLEAVAVKEAAPEPVFEDDDGAF